jgi:hypothetical protein
MSLEQTIGNLEIRYANVVTFVGSSNTMVDTTTGRIQTKGFQHNSNVITDISGPHGRIAPTLKKYPEIAFEEGKFDSNDTTNTYVQAGYTVSASRSQTAIVGENLIWEAFNGIASEIGMLLTGNNYDNDGNANTTGTTASRLSASDSTPYGEWLKLKLPNKIKLNKYVFTSRNDTTNWTQSAEAGQVWGSDNDSDWVHLHTFTSSGFTGASQTASFNVTTNNYYKYYAFIVTKTFAAGTNGYLCIPELEYYGYEEDPPAGDHSVDTTFKSRFNNPQLTGVQVLVDGATGVGTNQISGGPDPSGNDALMTSPNKYWTLNGTLTSNLAVEANTFLEGDQPHAVSVWFNSSNLEANVSNTCVFSVSDQEKLDSVNLDLQSNTWHNLTYAYQGEGGSKVTYLDGRKVAEDQAEDTFGEYPPLEMTGYSQGGYVVSASSEHDNGVRLSWKAFESGTGNETGLFMFNETGPKYGPTANTNAALFEGVRGEWIKLELPEKIYIASLFLRGSQDVTQSPEQIRILGSNDDVNWDVVKATFTVSNPAGDSNDVINSTKAYKYIVLQVIKVNGSTAVQIKQILYYGHRENDLVRLPDPTNVLKYPHIPFALGRGGYLDASGSTPMGEQSYSLRGYTVTSSSNYGNGGTDTRAGWNVFDEGGKGGTTHSIWQSGDYYVNNTTPGTYNRNPPERHTAGGVNYDGEWIKLELPHKINVTAIEINSAAYDHLTTHIKSRPYEGAILGSNDGSKTGTWDLLKAFSGGLTWTTTTVAEGGGRVTLTPDTNTGNAYKYLVLIVNKNEGPRGQFDINELKYFGTGVDSIPIQIGGGNIDKIANFRVYDKFIGEDQALEIWNAQKEEFGRAKPQMVLQQGKLGIGTDAPQGSLSVADEPDATTYYNTIQEFPPRAITVLDYHIHIVGHGKFEFSSSQGTWAYSYRGNASWDFTRVFTPRFITDGGWHGDSLSAPGTYQVLGVYAPAITSGDGHIQTTLKDGSVVFGDWIAMRTPYAINVTRIATAPRLAYGKARGIGKFVILGSNNGVDWEHTGSGSIAPHDFSSATDAGGYGTRSSETIAHVSTNSNGYYYTYHRLVATHIMGHRGASGHPQYNSGASESLNQAYLRFFGIREHLPPKQSILHDGQLTLTKNLTVPSIGPSVTNTRDVVPKRHNLVVEFDTSTNPADLTTVSDTSEMGNDGTLIGNAYYSIGDKAFVFDGSGDYIDTGVLSPSLAGAHPHSVSVWFKTNTTVSGTLQFVTCLGEKNGTTTDRRFSAIRVNGSSLQFWQWSNDLSKSGVISAGVWYHVVAVYLGGGTSQSTMLMYLNGEQITSWDADTTDGGALGLVSPSFAVGEDIGRSGYNFNGQISKPLVYDTVLTAGDVKTLYDMGRGDSYHVTNFQNTLVGINLGNGRAPRSALDVRDQIYARTSAIGTFTGQHICFPDEPMEKGLIVSAKKNKFVKLNGLAIGKSAITIDESLPIVSLSNVAQDKACFGVVSKMEESNEAYRTEITGGLVSESIKIAGDNRAIVNSVGEGAIWVVDTNGPLESGDYITTSNVAGYGQKQDDDVLHNFTVAKITMDCDFSGSNVAVQTIKREQTGTRTITEDAWNQLVEYDRYSNVEDEITTYYQIQRGGNVLDENGQLQFEDKTGATEEPYERRFLAADGSQTDEANTVHTAAFVGCTYHCG